MVMRVASFPLGLSISFLTPLRAILRKRGYVTINDEWYCSADVRDDAVIAHWGCHFRYRLSFDVRCSTSSTNGDLPALSEG